MARTLPTIPSLPTDTRGPASGSSFMSPGNFLAFQGGSNTPLMGMLPGATSPGYDPAYGGIPSVPSPTGTASNTIAGNLGNLSSLYNLATGTGAASGAGVIQGLEQEIPGVAGSIGKATSSINQLLSGEVPADVISQLAQQSAELGVGRGMGPMAPATNAQYLRSLGLTSLGMKEQGMQALDALMGSVPRAPAFNPASMLVDPQNAQEWAFLAQELANAPQPAAAARANVQALQQGMGVGGYSPIGGFNVPVRGGGTSSSSPLLGPEDTGYPTMPIYGPTGVPTVPNDPYANWQHLASTWTGSAPAAASYNQPPMTMEDYYNLGLAPAEEAPGEAAPASYEDYYGF